MKTVLVVDDSLTMRKMVMASLSGRYRFVQAGSGLEAIEQIAIEAVDVVLLDLNMPDMHGLDVLAFLRHQAPSQGPPVVVLTTRSDDDSRQKALEAGAVAYVTKPFVPSELSELVGRVLEA